MYSMMIVDFIFGSMYKVRIRIPIIHKIVDFIAPKASAEGACILSEMGY